MPLLSGDLSYCQYKILLKKVQQVLELLRAHLNSICLYLLALYSGKIFEPLSASMFSRKMGIIVLTSDYDPL